MRTHPYIFLLHLSLASSSSLLSWAFGSISAPSDKYVPKRDLKSLSWTTSGSLIEGSESSWWSTSWWFWSSERKFSGLFMKCVPLKPDRVCPLSLISAFCERESQEEPWNCMGTHEELRAQGVGDGASSPLEIQINYLGVDCPDEKEGGWVNPGSCILRYSLYRESSPHSHGSQSRSYFREFLLLVFLLLVAGLCIYFLHQNFMRRRLGRRLTNLRDLLAVNDKPEVFKRSRSSSDLRPQWDGGFEFMMNRGESEEDSLVTFPGTPQHGCSELSLLNKERRFENVLPTRRIRRSKSQSRFSK